jgi:hypothetical protein
VKFVLVLLAAVCTASGASELRPGVWAGDAVGAMPVSGYQVYLLGEMHGIQENVPILRAYLEALYRSGVRDVAIEEDAVHEPAAQEYVTGRSDRIPPDLCLRANVLDAVRDFNKGRSPEAMVRIRLVDIDSPADAIRLHLERVRDRVDPKHTTPLPKQSEAALAALRKLTTDPTALRDLRTIEHSIRALKLGFEVGLGQPKGSPYLDDREQAIAENLLDIAREPGSRGVLAFYGMDHVSKSMRRPNGEAALAPMALRLVQAGLRVYSAMLFPLGGKWSWRGRKEEMMWGPADGALSTGETFEHLTAAAPGQLLYVDRSREKLQLPGSDQNLLLVDGYVLIPAGTPLANRCAARGNEPRQ